MFSEYFADVIKEFNEKKLDKIKDHIFLDRFSVEHYIFAKLILSKKEKKYLEAYDALFSKLISKEELPDFAIYLDITFDTFKKRIFERGRESEINNWNENLDYFKELHENYLTIFKEIAAKFGMKYIIIDTNNKTEKEVFNEAVKIIEEETQNAIKGQTK